MIDFEKILNESDLFQHVEVTRVRAKKLLKSELPPSMTLNLPNQDDSDYCYVAFMENHVQVVSVNTFEKLFQEIEVVEAEVIPSE